MFTVSEEVMFASQSVFSREQTVWCRAVEISCNRCASSSKFIQYKKTRAAFKKFARVFLP